MKPCHQLLSPNEEGGDGLFDRAAAALSLNCDSRFCGFSHTFRFQFFSSFLSVDQDSNNPGTLAFLLISRSQLYVIHRAARRTGIFH